MLNSLCLPPFGRVLVAYQQESIRLDFALYIYVGKDAKEEAIAQKKMGTLCSFLSHGDDFMRFHWPIKDQKVTVYDTGKTTILFLKRFCFHLMTFDPRIIYLWSDTHPCEFFIPKGRTYNEQRS